jgi:hypothetical protein
VKHILNLNTTDSSISDPKMLDDSELVAVNGDGQLLRTVESMDLKSTSAVLEQLLVQYPQYVGSIHSLVRGTESDSTCFLTDAQHAILG